MNRKMISNTKYREIRKMAQQLVDLEESALKKIKKFIDENPDAQNIGDNPITDDIDRLAKIKDRNLYEKIKEDTDTLAISTVTSLLEGNVPYFHVTMSEGITYFVFKDTPSLDRVDFNTLLGILQELKSN